LTENDVNSLVGVAEEAAGASNTIDNTAEQICRLYNQVEMKLQEKHSPMKPRRAVFPKVTRNTQVRHKRLRKPKINSKSIYPTTIQFLDKYEFDFPSGKPNSLEVCSKLCK